MEVVAAVQHHVGFADQGVECGGIGALHQGPHLHIGVEGCKPAACRLGLRGSDGGHVVRDLALQIGQVHAVVVDDRDPSHAGAAQVQRHR